MELDRSMMSKKMMKYIPLRVRSNRSCEKRLDDDVKFMTRRWKAYEWKRNHNIYTQPTQVPKSTPPQKYISSIGMLHAPERNSDSKGKERDWCSPCLVGCARRILDLKEMVYKRNLNICPSVSVVWWDISTDGISYT